METLYLIKLSVNRERNQYSIQSYLEDRTNFLILETYYLPITSDHILTLKETSNKIPYSEWYKIELIKGSIEHLQLYRDTPNELHFGNLTKQFLKIESLFNNKKLTYREINIKTLNF